VYAIVRSGGKQHKVAVGETFTTEKVDAEPGTTVTLPALLLVDGETVTADAATLAGVTVSAEVVGALKGPKIRIIHYKNKTGYKKRQGHRQKLTELRVTEIKAAAAAGKKG
jgi:large subunit ribosomal protein L21